MTPYAAAVVLALPKRALRTNLRRLVRRAFLAGCLLAVADDVYNAPAGRGASSMPIPAFLGSRMYAGVSPAASFCKRYRALCLLDRYRQARTFYRPHRCQPLLLTAGARLMAARKTLVWNSACGSFHALSTAHGRARFPRFTFNAKTLLPNVVRAASLQGARATGWMAAHIVAPALCAAVHGTGGRVTRRRPGGQAVNKTASHANGTH